MNGFSNIKRRVKCTSAILLAALLTASCAEAAFISADAAEVQEQPSSSAVDLSSQERSVLYANSRTDFRDESIYFLITTRFYDGDPSNNARTSEDTKAQNPENDPSWRGDFKGLIDKLDYIKALGFTAIWITPVVENNSGYDYHGYHAYDFSAVDTRYESNGVTYQTLIDACHAKGIKVIQDIVLNHTCNWGERKLLPITNEVYGGGRSNYVMPAGDSLDPENIYHHTGFCGGGDWDNQEAQKKTIADDCFDLNTENPKVYNYLVDCYKNYINMGVDGFRVDTVKHISRLTFNSVFLPAFKQAGGEKFYMFGEVCTKGHDVWYRDNPPISTCFYTWADSSDWTGRWSNDTASNTSLLDEHYAAHMNMGNQPTSTNAFLNGNDYHAPDNSVRSGMDSIDFQMHWSFNSANEAYQTALGEDRYFSDSTWNVVYVDSHDYGPDNCQTLRYNFGTDAWAENLSLMFTFRGIPCIYYGSEIEFQAGKPIDVGPNQPLANTGRAYYGDNIEGNVNSTGFAVYDGLSGKVKGTLESTLSQHIMRLNRVRQAVPALRKGQYSTEGCSGSSGMAFKRRYTDSTTDSFALVTISGGATFTGIPNGRYVDAITGDVQNVSGGTLTANCSGRGNLRVYVLDTALTPAPGRVIPNGDYLNDGGSGTILPEEIIDDNPNPIDPTAITLSASTLSVGEGKTASLTATISPSNATNKSVTWTSSNTAVATVSGGKVTGVSQGTATITATTKNGLTATCKVTVTESVVVKPTGITLDKSSLSLNAGQSGTLSATITPADADNKTVTWTSSNSAVATVTDGTVKAVKKGTAVITASTFNGLEASCTVTVTEPAFPYVDKGFYFEKPSGWGSDIRVYFFNKSTNSQVGAAWPGASLTNAGNNIYTYNDVNTDANVVMIFNDGGSNQSPLKDQGGFAIMDQGYYTSSGFDHLVEKETVVEVTGVTISQSTLSMNVGQTVNLLANVVPSNATDTTLTWSSSDTSVVKVNSNGAVTAMKEGTAVITAASSNGKKATCTVTTYGNVPVNDLTNKSTIASVSIILGDSIVVNGAASGGSGSYTYSYYFKKNADSSWTTKLANTDQTSVSIKPGTSTVYNIKVVVKDGSGQTSEKQFNVSVNTYSSNLTNNSTCSSNFELGSPITIKGAASGGTGSYTYSYYFKKSTQDSWTTKIADTTTTSVTITPGSAVNYDIRVVVKDTNGKIAEKMFTVIPKPATQITNNSTCSSSITLGNSISVKGAASGGTSPYTYSYYFKKASQSDWTTKSANTTATSVTIKPGSAVDYNVRVVVKDNNGKSASKTFNVKVNASTLVNNSSLASASITLGNSFTVKGAASGGTGSYTYSYYFKQATQSSWSTKSANTTSTSVSIKPGSAVNYDVKVVVKDSSGKTAEKTFTVKVNAALANTSSVASTSVTLGNSITLKGAATGGTAPYTYSYYFKKDSQSEWTTKSADTTATSVTIKPGSAVKYNVKVVVKDKTGKTVSKVMNVNVTSALNNTSSVASATITLGNSITVKGAATGGTAPYTYSYYFKKSSSSSWATKEANTTATSVTIKPGSAVNYDVKVVVKDNSGKMVEKSFTVTVKAALTNTSSVASTSIKLGNSITVKGAATGGTAPYTYSYYFKKSSSSSWTTKEANTTATSVTIKPGSAVNYDVKVVVKDNTGKLVEKTMTVKVTN